MAMRMGMTINQWASMIIVGKFDGNENGNDNQSMIADEEIDNKRMIIGWWQGMTMIDKWIVDVVDYYKNGCQVDSRHGWWWQWEWEWQSMIADEEIDDKR